MALRTLAFMIVRQILGLVGLGPPDPVARVTPGPPTSVSATAGLLVQAIPRRHANRRPFAPTAVPPEVLADLCAAAAIEGAHLVVVDFAMRDAVVGVVRAAEPRRRRDPEYLNELAEWTVDIADRRNGMPTLMTSRCSPPGHVRGAQPMRCDSRPPSRPVVACLGSGRLCWNRRGPPVCQSRERAKQGTNDELTVPRNHARRKRPCTPRQTVRIAPPSSRGGPPTSCCLEPEPYAAVQCVPPPHSGGPLVCLLRERIRRVRG